MLEFIACKIIIITHTHSYTPTSGQTRPLNVEHNAITILRTPYHALAFLLTNGRDAHSIVSRRVINHHENRKFIKLKIV